MSIIDLMQEMATRHASDLHLCADQPPAFRIDGRLLRAERPPLSAAELDAMARELLDEGRLAQFAAAGEIDFAHSLDGAGRYRVNLYRQRSSTALALRLIPHAITPLRDLPLPNGVADTLATLCGRPSGLVLVTGPTGSGKSTTLAGMIDLINRDRSCHVITIEDPIEYVHQHRRAVINQREMGEDTHSFARALRAALRQDPDVILLGEMRDLETMQTALEAAETGHLVLATLHTNGAAAAIDRLIDAFPANQQTQVRVQLAAVIQGVICQRLFRRRDGAGRFAATEVLIATPAMRNLIRESKTHQLTNVIQTGTKLGMRTMGSAVRELYDRGIIGEADLKEYQAEEAASRPLAEAASLQISAPGEGGQGPRLY